MAELAVYDNDQTIYLFTSLTAGSSHIITATSRIETILKANKVPFKGVDTATDDLARKLFQRRASGKKLPLIVKQGYVLGGIEEIEEWNEYDELREALGVTSAFTPLPAKPSIVPPASSAATATTKKENVVQPNPQQNLAIRQLGAEAAKAAAAKKQAPAKISTTNPLLAEKTNTPTSATATPTKSSAKGDGGILSPKSIPLPQTPKTPASAIPNLANLQKGVAAPPKIQDDAANPDLAAGPTSEAQDETDKDKGKGKELKGVKVAEASKADIKKVEEATAIPEKKSGEEESSEEEEESDEEEDEDEEDESEEDEDEKDEEEATEYKKADAPTKAAVKTQDQDPKDASKAGESVKEGEEGSEDEDDEDEEESSEEEAKEDTATPVAAEKKPTEAKKSTSTKKSSSSKKSTLDKKPVTADKKKATETTKKSTTTTTTKKKSAAKPSLLGALADANAKKRAADKKKAADKKADAKSKEPVKTQKQDAKDGSKAGESVKD